jgi:hypothetical protein
MSNEIKPMQIPGGAPVADGTAIMVETKLGYVLLTAFNAPGKAPRENDAAVAVRVYWETSRQPLEAHDAMPVAAMLEWLPKWVEGLINQDTPHPQLPRSLDPYYRKQR